MAESNLYVSSPYVWGNTIRTPRPNDSPILESVYQSSGSYTSISGDSSSGQGLAFWGYKFSDNEEVQAIAIVFFRNQDAGDVAFAKRQNGEWKFSPAYNF